MFQHIFKVQPTCRHTFQCISTKYTKDKWRLGCWKPNFWGACHQPFLKIFSFTSSLTNLNASVQLQNALTYSTGPLGCFGGFSWPFRAWNANVFNRRLSIWSSESNVFTQAPLPATPMQYGCFMLFLFHGRGGRWSPTSCAFEPWLCHHGKPVKRATCWVCGLIASFDEIFGCASGETLSYPQIHPSWIRRFQPIDHLGYRKKLRRNTSTQWLQNTSGKIYLKKTYK